MFKLLAIFILIWIFFRAIGMVIKMVIGGASSDKRTSYSNTRASKQEGDISIDHNPNKSNKGYDGGEYVDYEDVD